MFSGRRIYVIAPLHLPREYIEIRRMREEGRSGERCSGESALATSIFY
jgi:hypothetical protein